MNVCVCSKLLQPMKFEISFLQSQISMDELVSKSLLPRSVENRPTGFRSEIQLE